MTHIPIQEALEGKMVEWLEKVSDEDYQTGDQAQNRKPNVVQVLCRAHGRLIFMLSFWLALTSCALFFTKESRYLRAANNQATEVDVTQHLGDPAEITSDEKGQAVWVYQTRKQIQQGTNSSWVTFPAWQCDRYRLTFDDHQILREWTHTSREC